MKHERGSFRRNRFTSFETGLSKQEEKTEEKRKNMIRYTGRFLLAESGACQQGC